MYNHRDIEQKWRAKWNDGFVSYSPNPGSDRKRYILVEFPFPSGAGLHVGHTKSYMAMDIRARKYRMEGDDVLYPMGWDAFGLPTENYAITHGIHPRIATEDNIKTFRDQIDALGISFDWSREINTTDPAYYKWTQWIFMQMFKHGLAYQDTTQVWWCEEMKTVLANEEVIDGLSERGGHPCERKPLRQWMLAITKYAQRLHDDLDQVEYLDIIKRQQRNWIGMSQGARITFPVKGHDAQVEVYTTRPDTLYGVTFMVLAPEHPLVAHLVSEDQQSAVQAYQQQTSQKTDLDRQQEKEKSGVFTGGFVIHPLTGESIPVWIADYVLMDYGTGAIMAVPAHDERDREFAEKYGLDIIIVIDDAGTVINSQEFDGLTVEEAKEKITSHLTKNNIGTVETQSKLRDWVFSRQRYWGEPFPIIWVTEQDYHEIKATNPNVIPAQDIQRDTDGVIEYAVTIADSELPLELPEVESYIPQGLGEGPLALATDWVNVWYEISTGKTISASDTHPGAGWVAGTRETDTMPNWAGSSWYFMRYIDPTNTEALASPDRIKNWLPVDIYNGGMEHTTLHLLYSRFWYKFLYDIGVVPTTEPYQRRISHGMILAEGGIKMSKSKGNTINPLEMCDSFGADSMRCYIMFMGPYDEAVAWDTHGLVGCNRFLTKVYYWGEEIISNPDQAEVDTKELLRDTHALIKKISQDIEAQKLNTCISSFMEYINTWGGKTVGKDTFETFLTLLAPFAPHLTEELWERLGHTESIHTSTSWPVWDESYLVTTEEDFQVHVNGKMRAMITVPVGTDESEISKQALEAVTQYTEGKAIKTQKVILAKKIVIVVV